MNVRTTLLTISLLIITLFTQAQNSFYLDKIYTTEKSVPVSMPFMIDSVNMKGAKFDKKELMQTFIALPNVSAFTEELRADVTYEYFFLPKAQQESRFHFMAFQLTTDKYAKVKVKVTSPGMFELYADGKKEIAKSTIEDSLKLAKVLDKELNMTPGTTSFVIKYLSLPSNVAPEGVKIAIETSKSDSLTKVQVGYNGKRLVTIEDIAGGTRLTGTKISPNGQFVILSYKTVDKEGKTVYRYELLNTKTNLRMYIGSRALSWMPKSNLMYYTEKIGDELQLRTINPENMESKVLREDISSGSFYFTPDEKSLIFNELEKAEAKKGDLNRLLSPEDRRPGYSDRYFIYKFDIESGLKQRLTYGKQSTILNDISGDSRYILFTTNKETLTESPYQNTSMFRLDMQTMKLDTLFTNEFFIYSGQFSPDGKNVLIDASPAAFNKIGSNLNDGETPNGYDRGVYIMDIASKQIDPITKNFAPSVNKSYWNRVDNMIYLNVVDKDYENIYCYNPLQKRMDKVNLPEDVIRQFSLADNSATAAYLGTSLSNPARGYLLDLKSLKSVLIDDSYKTELEKLDLGEVKDWNFTASDGSLINGRYYLPPNFDGTKKYPLIVYYYGGTTPVARTFDYPYPMHVYAAMGYVVYVIQPSGAIGFGEEFSARHVNAWGKRTADEIIEGTKLFAKEHSFVNDKKIGCIGASYGGFMTMYLQTQTDLFAAAVSHAGISALSSYWGEGYWGYTYSSVASAGSYPWNNKELYIEQSPLFNADKIHTPLLLLHGTEDTNVPIGESIQMYTALKVLGRPVEFIQVKGENHGILNYKKRIEWNHSIYAWFAKWLKDDTLWWNSMYPKN